jgi:small subunit ribosomal protein S16
MATRIRLQRHGRKGRAIFHIVAADQRAPRDGRFIEKLGVYNPNTNPATIDLNFEAALKWVQNGAEPSDTVKAILSYKGVMYKHHLLNGVKKGALTPEQVEERFDKWLEEKINKVNSKKEGLMSNKEKARAEKLEAEKIANQKKAEAIAAKNAPEPVAEEAPAEAEAAAEESAE